MNNQEIKNCYSKVCLIAYQFDDVERIVDWCKKRAYKYAFIKHIGQPQQFDSNEYEGDITKDHYHILILSSREHRFKVNSLVSKTLGFNLIFKLKDEADYLRYLLHLDYDDKEHYQLSDIISNFAEKELIDYIYHKKKKVSYNDILSKAIEYSSHWDAKEYILFNDFVQLFIDEDISLNQSLMGAIHSVINAHNDYIKNYSKVQLRENYKPLNDDELPF